MKRILLIVGLVALVTRTQATPIVVPGSSFPITNNPQAWMRFLMVDTNGQASADPLTQSNATIRYDDLSSDIVNQALLSLSQSITNPVFYTSSNNAAYLSFTNPPGGTTILDFANVSKSNAPSITWSGTPGDAVYGSIKVDPLHGGSPTASAGNSEFQIVGARHIAIVPGVGSGNASHIQVGGNAYPTWLYMSAHGTGNPFVYRDAGPIAFQIYWESNATVNYAYPGWYARWSSTNTATTAMEWRMAASPDVTASMSNEQFNSTNQPESFTLKFGIAPGGSNYNSIDLVGALRTPAGATNTLSVNSNGIYIGGPGPLVVSNQFQLGQNQLLQSLAGTIVEVGINASSRFLVVDGTGNGGAVHSYFDTGPQVGGAYFYLGNGVGFGTNAPALHGKTDTWGLAWHSIGESGPTNYVAANFTPPPNGDVAFVKSNNWIWAVSDQYTNRCFQFGP